MKSKVNLLNEISLTSTNRLNNIVENKTTFQLKNCEFSIYETHQTAKNVKLHFNDLAFTSMLRGKKVMKLENKTNYFDYLPSESLLISPGETMIIDFPEADKTPSQCLSLSLSSDYINNSLDFINHNTPKIDDSSQIWGISSNEYFLLNDQSLTSATNNIMRIAMDNSAHKDIMADFAIKELIIRLMQTQARKILERESSTNQTRMGYIISYIKKNIHQKISIKSIAKQSYVSESNIFKIFKQEIGISPNEFIIKERLKKAKELLLEHQTIKEVTYQTGFSDTNYFTRVFHQHEGITPKNFQIQSKIL
ncbi:helix-turn-helix domain-containing protein [Frigoriflavimonas asaccharolytica]|uniref:AraC-like DNA-binding protein n=1 Tax=Frigoriflavimonas asaccharolytica TaxID=2735899 RepID=A0A8J8G8D6_9FLAO|nr:helix-turn-helix domain-containing protein [Frigoriflavimonas asaccharolytica]NRS91180.1 AraC-like DNA-binding protein [Frigoriflavimonas asaccharolytica]